MTQRVRLNFQKPFQFGVRPMINIAGLTLAVLISAFVVVKTYEPAWAPQIPRVWDERALADRPSQHIS